MRDRIRSLDGLRASACFAVMAFHTAEGGPLRGGFLGVDVFFVLSGFLAAYQLTGGADPVEWLYRRAARLWPALLALVAMVLALSAVTSTSALAAVAALLYVYGPMVAIHYPFGDDTLVAHTWSLSIEMQFYAAAAVVVWVLRRRQIAIQPAWVLGLASASFVARSAYVLSGNGWRGYFATETRLASLLVGVAVGIAASRGGAVRWLRPEWTLLPLLVTLIGADPYGWSGSIAGSLAASAFTLSVLTSTGGVVNRVLSSRPLVALGARTYSLYLWHQPVFSVLKFHAPLRGAVLVGAEWASALLVAELSYRLVEQPARKWLYARYPVPADRGPARRAATGRRSSSPGSTARQPGRSRRSRSGWGAGRLP